MASKKGKKKTVTATTLVVQSKLKELVKKNKMNCSSDVVPEFNRIIADHIGKGVERARANGRKTLRATDL